jgi:DNA-binding response OmpR family regulator
MSGQARTEANNRTVLLADGNRQIVRVLSIALRSVGFQITSAATNREALEVVQQVGAVVLNTPLADGTAKPVLDWLKANIPAGQLVPFWIVTSTMHEDEVVKALGPLQGPFLPKPFDPWRLIELLEERLGRLA